MDKNVKVIYDKLENITFNNQGYINLSNSKIEKTNDIVNICDIFRNPRYETFRIFYIKENRIVGQESITSKMPDAVILYSNGRKFESNPIKTYEKMNNRIRRLGADGYYLVHNHSSSSAKPSQEDMKITYNFATNVKGFFGHIILGNADKYSVIEKNSEGLILMPTEQRLKKETLENIEEQLKESTLYDIKISCRDELIAILRQIKNEKDYSTAILTDSKNKIRVVLDIPNRMFNQQNENLNGFFKNIARNCGAIRVFIGTQDKETYNKVL